MTELSSFEFAALLLGEELVSAIRTEFVILLKGQTATATVRLVSPTDGTSAVVWDHAEGTQMLLCGQPDYVKAEFSRLAANLSARRRLAHRLRTFVMGREMRGQLAIFREFACGLRRLVARNAVRGHVQAAE